MPLENVNERYEHRRTGLSQTDREIGDWIMENPAEFSRMSIQEVSETVGVAKSSISRFAKRLGYRGLRDFRNDVLRVDFDYPTSVPADITPEDSTEEIFHKTFEASIRFMYDTMVSVGNDSFSQAVELIVNTRTLGLFGMGVSGLTAQAAYRHFALTTKRTVYDTELHTQLTIAAGLTKEDCALVISASGSSTDTKRVLAELKRGGCNLIGITGNNRSALARQADVVLLLPGVFGGRSFAEQRAIFPAQVVLINALCGAVGTIIEDNILSGPRADALDRSHL